MGDTMKQNSNIRLILCGGAAGLVNGLLGTGGGMILIPLLCMLTDLPEERVFPTSVCIILPICVVALTVSGIRGGGLPFTDALPYLIGSLCGGIIAGLTDNRIPVKWLHRLLGILIIWGGVRYLC